VVEEEKDRIKRRIDRARRFDRFTELYDAASDASEGGGLGIILSSLLLKNAGISPDNLSITADESSITSSVRIPYDFRPIEVTSIIRDKFYDMIGDLPALPENIREIDALCGDPSVSIHEIADKIMNDPGLTADILKLSNSSGYYIGRKIESIGDSLMVIGIKHVRAFIAVTAINAIMREKYSKFEDIWNHCAKSAFFARALARECDLTYLGEQAFLAGLLHDIGKIVLLSAGLDVVDQIAGIVANHKIRSSSIIEEASIGISHAEIGALMAVKWNFPEFLVECIRYHHAPLSSGHAHRSLVFLVHLANQLIRYKDPDQAYSVIENQVLEFFGVPDEARLAAIHENINRSYGNL
jgi:putative nucleotidyltransferase with HDIG domain